jgi:hypothetical protein
MALLPMAAFAGPEGLSVENGWMRVLLPSRPAAGYFELVNAGSGPAELTGASSPGCGALMLHRTVSQNGQDKMEMVASVPVPAGAAVSFAPGGYHLMCMKPQPVLTPGATVPVTLSFADGSTLTADFDVRGATGE